MIWRLFIVLILISNNSFAGQGFFSGAARGWHWYENNKKKQEEEAKALLSPSEKIKAINQELESRLNKAIIYPNEKNIVSYIKLQKDMMDRSERFANNWQKAIYYHPELDERIKNPITQAARPIYYAKKQQDTERKIKYLAKEYGLIYIYRSGCPYCQQFAFVVKMFSEKYNWQVLGVSLDGKSLEEFPNSKQDNGIAETLGIKVVPALIAVHPKDNTYIPLAYGYISQNEMENRINLLVGQKDE